MRKKHVENIIKDLTEWKEKVFGSGLELKVTYNSFLGLVDHISVDSGLPSSSTVSGYSPVGSYKGLLSILKKEIVEQGWVHANYPKINLAKLDNDDLEIFRDYLKKIEEELGDTQAQIDDLLEERKDLAYGIKTVRRRMGYQDVETKR